MTSLPEWLRKPTYFVQYDLDHAFSYGDWNDLQERILNALLAHTHAEEGMHAVASLGVGVVERVHLADRAVGPAQLSDGAVTTQKIEEGAITPPKLADESVGPTKLARGAISSVHLGKDSVTTSSIESNAIKPDKLDDRAVGTRALADGAVTTRQLGLASVTADRLGPDAYSAPLTLGHLTWSRTLDLPPLPSNPSLEVMLAAYLAPGPSTEDEAAIKHYRQFAGPASEPTWSKHWDAFAAGGSLEPELEDLIRKIFHNAGADDPDDGWLQLFARQGRPIAEDLARLRAGYRLSSGHRNVRTVIRQDRQDRGVEIWFARPYQTRTYVVCVTPEGAGVRGCSVIERSVAHCVLDFGGEHPSFSFAIWGPLAGE